MFDKFVFSILAFLQYLDVIIVVAFNPHLAAKWSHHFHNRHYTEEKKSDIEQNFGIGTMTMTEHPFNSKSKSGQRNSNLHGRRSSQRCSPCTDSHRVGLRVATSFICLVATLVINIVVVVEAQNNSTHFLDRFTYEDENIDRGDGFFDYRPQDWNDIRCDERTRESLDECIAYPSKWHEGIDWKINQNYCRWCPEDQADDQPCSSGFDSTGQQIRHHQSPIDLQREFGLDIGTHPNAKECVDCT
jgi:hypothetical protein